MSLKATREQVEAALKKLNVFDRCEISDEINGKVVFRSSDGLIINFFVTTGTVQCQGANKSLADKFKSVLQEQPLIAGVFVVYGRDNVAKAELEAILRRMGVSPTILSQCVDAGQTLIEKLEKYLNPSDYVCVLLTPDDKGGLITENVNEYRPRARQNVILELGWAIGKLGRDRVAIIRKNSVDKPCENPSDLDGILDLRYDASIEEVKLDLAKRLDEAGYKVDYKSL